MREMRRVTPNSGPCRARLPNLGSNEGPADYSSGCENGAAPRRRNPLSQMRGLDLDSNQGPADISSLRNQSPVESSRQAASRRSESSSWTNTQVRDRKARKRDAVTLQPSKGSAPAPSWNPDG